MYSALATLILFSALTSLRAGTPDDEYRAAFTDFKHRFNKVYRDEAEIAERFEKFKATYDYIKLENGKATNPYELGINEFSDLTPDEFAKSRFGYQMPAKLWGNVTHLGTHVYSGAPLADSVDWTTKGAVTKVKNQGQCGSCWSFSTTGSLEGALQIATGKLVSLSEEMLVDCSKQNHGCGGGSMDLAFQYVEQTGLCTEESYPYTAGGGHVGSCKATSCTKGLKVGAVTGFHDVKADSEQALMEAVGKGPVSIAVEADKPVFQSYKSGVMSGMCGTKLDHGILIVGYGTENGNDYWKVKNSWGSVWGEEGYGKLLRGKGGGGECGILMGATYPVVSGKPGPSPGPSPPSPSPPPSPTPGSSHYEDPKDGCQADEQAIQIQGIKGAFCSPACSGTQCPTDVPSGVTAQPECALKDPSSNKYCALICTPGSNECGKATCKSIQGTGICTYDDDGPSPGPSPPPSPPSPGDDCILADAKGDCEAKATEGCHWCKVFDLGICLPKLIDCPKDKSGFKKVVTTASFSRVKPVDELGIMV